MADPKAAAAAQNSKGLPQGFRAYTPFPFSGMNVQDAPTAIDDKEFSYMLNFLRIGGGMLRTAWDAGPAIYRSSNQKIVYYFFYYIGTTGYVAVFLADGSAIQLQLSNLAQTTIAGPGTFYDGTQVPACAQWGTLYLLISNNNAPNDFWVWDGTTLYEAGTAAPNGVVLLATGSSYGSNPTVTAFGGHGSGMTFTPTVQAGGVVNVQIDDPGSGYEVGDIVQLAFSGGGSNTSAELVADLNPGTVAAANITAPGSGYTMATAAFSGGGGTGAAGTPIISTGSVSSIAVTAGGSGYTGGVAVSFTGGSGSGATATANVSGGVLVSIDVTNPGTGYTSAPTVVLTASAGSGATATATVSASGTIVGMTITAPGSGYTSAPGIVISGDGTGATAVAVLAPTSVSGVTVVNGGTGFVYAPNVEFVGGGGAGATGVATLTPTSIAKVNVVAGGQNYAKPPTVTFTGAMAGSGATAVAVLDGGQVVAVNVTNGGSGYTSNVEVVFTPVKGDPGSGAGAIAIFSPTSISGVTMSNYGLNYTDAPAVEVQSGANQSAYATVTLMPFGVSGSWMETFQQRLWIGDPAPAAYGTLPPGGNWQVSAPGGFTDFATSDGGVLFTNTDGFLKTRYVAARQSNGYLYFFGDDSISVVSNTNTTGSPATTTFNYQNVDPQTGLAWRDSLIPYGRTLLFGNNTGVFGVYGGAATPVSHKLDQLFANAVLPPTAGALTPTSAIATLFNVKHYLMLLTVTDPDTGQPSNVMVTWNEKEWVLTSQSIDLVSIGYNEVNSQFTAYGTDGSAIYPLFQTPSATLPKRLDTKYYGGDNPLMIKELYGVWMCAQDQSATLAGIDCDLELTLSGLALQNNPAAPNMPNPSVPSVETGGTLSLLVAQPQFQAPPPYFPVWGTGVNGSFMNAELKLTTTSPDFTLSHLMLGYTETLAFYS